MKRTILPILVVALLFIVPTIPGMKTEEKNMTVEEAVMNVMIGNDDDGFEIDTIVMEKPVIMGFVDTIQEFQTWISSARPFQDLILTTEEINEIKTRVNGLVDSINILLSSNDHNPRSAEWLFHEMFENEPARSTIVSVGVGYAFIPFYDYETFIGIMLRPMWLWYPPIFFAGGGYTGNLNINVIPPRIEYGDRLGGHLVRTTVFSGVYINIGELGYDGMLLGGPMILLGQARVVM